MRVSTLSAVCASALILPAAAAPLATTTALHLPLGPLPTMNVALDGPSEIPNLPLPGAPAPSLPGPGRNNQVQRLSKSKSKLARLPRGADFRQADYGVNRNVTLVQVPGPVQGIEAKPADNVPSVRSSAPARRSEEDWEANRLHPDYAAAADSPDDLSQTASDAPDAAASAPAAAPPLAIGNLQNADVHHIPVHPNMAAASKLAGQGIQTTGETRYRTAYSTHDLLGQVFDKTQPVLPQAGGVPKAGPAQLNKLPIAAPSAPVPGGLLRRLLRPTQYIAARAFSLAKDLKGFSALQNKKGMGSHTLQLDTNPLLPSQPDPTLNMSDPYVAQEEMRRQHAGVLNIDSNRAAPPPPAPAPALPTPSGAPLNATDAANSTASSLDGGAGKTTPLPVDEAKKTSVDKAEGKPIEKAEKKAEKA
ncbi:hypothetical protein C8Q77DRAFT_1160738 [Trametes polyzona]|nr:hypothetical protein C8Q77DRAFT_1160738 [Trametes polyzona]